MNSTIAAKSAGTAVECFVRLLHAGGSQPMTAAYSTTAHDERSSAAGWAFLTSPILRVLLTFQLLLYSMHELKENVSSSVSSLASQPAALPIDDGKGKQEGSITKT